MHSGWRNPLDELKYVQAELAANRQREKDAQELIKTYAEREQQLLEKLQVGSR